MQESEGREVPVPLVLAIEPDQATLGRVGAALESTCRLVAAAAAEAALQMLAAGVAPDLILLDASLAKADGYALARRLRVGDVPLILLAERLDAGEVERMFAAGAADFVTRPVVAPLLAARVRTQLKLRRQESILRTQAGSLKSRRSAAATAVAAVRDAAFGALTAVARMRGGDSDAHLVNTQRLVEVLCAELADHPHFSGLLTADHVRLIAQSAPLHDIGKVGIPDHILLKPGKLSPEEFDVMKAHTQIGCRAMLDAAAQLGAGEENFLHFGCEIALSHHERWDGSGYPSGLSGTQIPASARITAVADVYDAFISHRLYKEAQPHEMAVALIAAGRGTAFDPDVVDAFARVADQFDRIETEQRR